MEFSVSQLWVLPCSLKYSRLPWGSFVIIPREWQSQWQRLSRVPTGRAPAGVAGVVSPDEGAEAQRGCASRLGPHSRRGRAAPLWSSLPVLPQAAPAPTEGAHAPKCVCVCLYRAVVLRVSCHLSWFHNLGKNKRAMRVVYSTNTKTALPGTNAVDFLVCLMIDVLWFWPNPL